MSDIEDMIAGNLLTAAQVYTRMSQTIASQAAEIDTLTEYNRRQGKLIASKDVELKRVKKDLAYWTPEDAK